MKITSVKVHAATMAASWLTETVIASPMSVFPEYKARRSSWYGTMTAVVVEVQTDEGIHGLGFVGGSSSATVSLIQDKLQLFLIGKDPFQVELIWDQLWRASQHYGRRGAAVQAISGIDIALWDIIGKATNQPVYRLIGGKTKDKIRAYATGNDTKRHLELGFRDVKIAVPRGPVDGRPGMKENEALVARTRDLIGDDGEIMLDCYMAWDVPYAIQMARMLEPYRIKWIEEPVLPDKIDSYRAIRENVSCLVAGGEHEYTRWGFKELIEKQAVDILQPDIYRAGGITELRRICALASAWDLPVIPHGVGAPTYHLIMSQMNCPAAEFVDIFAQGGELMLRGEPIPQQGFIELPDTPGFGYELNPNVFTGRGPVPIW